MKETVWGLLILSFLSLIDSREIGLSDLPDDVIEHFKNFGLLDSLNIDQNSVEIVPAVSGQSYGSQKSNSKQPPTIPKKIEGSTLPPDNSNIYSPAPYVEEVTVQPNVDSRTNIPQEQYPGPTQPFPERPVYIRVIQPLHIPVPQPYPVEVRVPTPVYVRVPSEGYPIGIQNALRIGPDSTIGEPSPSGPPTYQIIAPKQELNGLLSSYVASRVGGVYRNSFNPYQTIDYRRTWQ